MHYDQPKLGGIPDKSTTTSYNADDDSDWQTTRSDTSFASDLEDLYLIDDTDLLDAIL
jgi:hypothetical protein